MKIEEFVESIRSTHPQHPKVAISIQLTTINRHTKIMVVS